LILNKTVLLVALNQGSGLDDVPIALRQKPREHCTPNRLMVTVVINFANAEKREINTIFLNSMDELEVEVDDKSQLTNLIMALLKLELEDEDFIGAALTEPIDDSNAKDPKTV
jgi:hypothetical protein